ncbi:helix-turn-helix domain-containing protein [Fodinicola acaciae]|uniref:helix-turn-helix domain-containing protein n=1 Tax=Fodinicola acaciae TaxID=2681555 RepID=UPI0013D77F97|nr:helix-turn-helix domain-containing protein [Fodinicola acaciae]
MSDTFASQPERYLIDPADEPVLLTIPEAMAILAVNRWGLQRLIWDRQLATVKIGGRRLVPEEAVSAVLERRLVDIGPVDDVAPEPANSAT